MNESEGPSVESEIAPPPVAANRPAERELGNRIFYAMLLGLVVLALAPFLIPTATRMYAGLAYPYQMDSEEGFVLWQAWQLRHGQNIFRPLNEPPYVAATYGPVYPLMGAATLWGKKPSFFGGRLIAALSVLAICALMAAIVWTETRRVLPAALGPLLFLNTYDVYSWLPFYRVDFTALAIGLAGLYLLMQWRRQNLECGSYATAFASASSACRSASAESMASGRKAVAWLPHSKLFGAACACFVAMVYTKQVEVWPFVAALIYLLIVDRRAAWRLFRNVAAWGLAVAVVLTLITWGQFLVHNIYYNANPFNPWQLRVMLRHFFGFHRFFLPAVIIGAVWLILDLKARNRERGTIGLFALYAVLASTGLLGLGKIGAATNYIIEPKAALSLFVALVVARMLAARPIAANPLGRFTLVATVLLLLLFHSAEFLFSSTLHITNLPPHLFRRGSMLASYLYSRPPVLLASANRNPTSLDRLNGARIVSIFRESKDPIFSEHAIFPMLAGREVYMQPFIMSQLAREEKWDPKPVVQALREGRFAWIASTEDITKEGFLFHYTPEMATAIREAYRLEEVFAGTPTRPATFTHYLFIPKGS